MDVTGVPSADPGHRSATPVVVAALWAFNAGQDKLAPPPLLFRRHQPSELTSRWGKGLAMARALPRGALCMRGRDPGPPSCGVRDFHAPPDLLVRTLAPRPGGPGQSHAITTARTLQDDRHNLHGTKDETQDDSNARRLPTVLPTVFDHCTRDSGGNDDFRALHSCTPPPPCDYKRRRRTPLSGARL